VPFSSISGRNDSHGGAAAGGSSQLQLLQALQQVNGLKLLPLADGHLQAIYAGLHTDLSRVGANSRPIEQFIACAVYVAVSMEEQQLLQGLKQHMLHQGVSKALRQQLQAVAAAGVSNVHVLTAGRFDSHVLGLLMPPEWHSSRGHVEVSWRPDPYRTVPQQQQQSDGTEAALLPAADTAAVPAGDAAAGTAHDAGQAAGEQQQQQQQGEACQQPSRELIQLCWRWLADRGDAADVVHWPLLPVTGSKLRLLQQPAQVRPAAAFRRCTLCFNARVIHICTSCCPPLGRDSSVVWCSASFPANLSHYIASADLEVDVPAEG
jgi:hypothetical protein